MDPPRKRGRGRPRLYGAERTWNVAFRMRETDYDRLCRIAIRRQVSVADLLRAGVRRLLNDEPPRE